MHNNSSVRQWMLDESDVASPPDSASPGVLQTRHTIRNDLC